MAEQPPRYSLIYAPEVLPRIRRWVARTTDPGQRAGLLDALRAVDRNLKYDPVGWGDFQWNYRVISARECRGMIPHWFVVWYAVDVPARTVSIRDIRPAPGSPLERPS
ncbi:hypothetical protein [Limnoglobus roseus]|uniref:Type II toxin-antitoxin system RelE/ParE family toxin n=1 Tax=Limnoglobus roseus TaxID=2598579 RepID=A0A5C1APD5_9BACT|nr:hypothetical protein [Limnoglobus roseus]QEL21031.1 hypothetical protein PX52LOC_08160 [Limnoglobus roseus]